MYTRPHLAASARASTLQCSLSLLEQHTPQLVIAGAPPYDILDVNEAWLQVCQFRREEVIGHVARAPYGAQLSHTLDTCLCTKPSDFRKTYQLHKMWGSLHQ